LPKEAEGRLWQPGTPPRKSLLVVWSRLLSILCCATDSLWKNMNCIYNSLSSSIDCSIMLVMWILFFCTNNLGKPKSLDQLQSDPFNSQPSHVLPNTTIKLKTLRMYPLDCMTFTINFVWLDISLLLV
jgi:hypothetical protein